VVALLPLSEQSEHSDLVKSGFRKMIIVNTASIIEGLLLYILKKQKSEEDLATKRSSFKEILIVHRIDEKTRIVKGEDHEDLIPCKFNKLNLDGIIKLCKEHSIITDKELLKELGDVRDLRNKQHVGTLSIIDGGYSKKDLEFVFSVAKEIKKLAQKAK
jgi:hypothetical protein